MAWGRSKALLPRSNDVFSLSLLFLTSLMFFFLCLCLLVKGFHFFDGLSCLSAGISRRKRMDPHLTLTDYMRLSKGGSEKQKQKKLSTMPYVHYCKRCTHTSFSQPASNNNGKELCIYFIPPSWHECEMYSFNSHMWVFSIFFHLTWIAIWPTVLQCLFLRSKKRKKISSFSAFSNNLFHSFHYSSHTQKSTKHRKLFDH